MSKKVFVGLSGGVDSSVSALLLQQQGYDVTGVYMKNWSKTIAGIECPWQEDYQDAKRTAAYLGIPFKMFDLEGQYYDLVVGYMLDAFRQGITPNPDVMCNQEIKFKVFLDMCLDAGADMIATGHYAGTTDGRLHMAKDSNKDQTYFLYRVTSAALKKTIFPLANYTKPEVRVIAKKHNLPTANRKESMGICFVGKVGIRDFLKEYIDDYAPGPIVDQKGTIIGTHEGAIFYTIGQRSGLGVGGGLPYYVTGKDMASNTVFVTTNLDDSAIWNNKLKLTSIHWISGRAKKIDSIRTRHRAPLVDVECFLDLGGDQVELLLTDKVRALTPGQSAVFYKDDQCLGGGIITK